MDYARHGEIQGRYLVFLKLTALYFTMFDIVHVKKKSRVLEKPDFCQFAKNSLLENDGCLVDF